MASGLTPDRSRPYPLETDAPDVAADIHALALDLDLAVNMDAGATLPSSGFTRGDEFYLTTTSTWYKYSGAAWYPMLVSTPWVSLTMPAHFNTPGGGLVAPRYRQVGSFVYLDGYFQSGSSFTSTATFSNAPAPSADWQVDLGSGHTAMISVVSNNLIVDGFTAINQGVFLSSRFYPTD